MTEPAAAAIAPIVPASENTPAPDETKNDVTAEIEPWKKVKHKYRANGVDHEVDYDQLIKRAEKAEGAEKRLAEANRKERDVTERMEKIGSAKSLAELVDLFGGDAHARKLAEEFVYAKMIEEEQDAALSPAERKALEAERRAEGLEAELKKRDAAAQETDKKQASSMAVDIVNREVDAAIAEAEKEGLSPEDVPAMIEALVDGMITHLEYLEDCEKAGMPSTEAPLSPRDVLRKLQDKDKKKSESFLKKISAKDLRLLLSQEQLEGLGIKSGDTNANEGIVNRAAERRQGKANSDEPIDPRKGDGKELKDKPKKDWFAAMDDRFKQTKRR